MTTYLQTVGDLRDYAFGTHFRRPEYYFTCYDTSPWHWSIYAPRTAIWMFGRDFWRGWNPPDNVQVEVPEAYFEDFLVEGSGLWIHRDNLDLYRSCKGITT